MWKPEEVIPLLKIKREIEDRENYLLKFTIISNGDKEMKLQSLGYWVMAIMTLWIYVTLVLQSKLGLWP